jgi:hypothetical protein
MDVARAQRPMNLALPASALGAGGALVAADYLRVGCVPGDHLLGELLVATVPLAAAGLGFFFSLPAVSARGYERLAPALASCVAGTFLGAFIGAVCWGEPGFAVGAANGLAFGAAFSVAFAVIVAAVRRTGRARPASIVDASDRLLVAAAVAALLGVAACLAQIRRTAYPHCAMRPTATPVVAVVCAVTLAVVVALQSIRFARASALMAKARQVFADALAPGVARVDFGVGDELGAEYAARRSAYRDKPAAVKITLGSASFARQALAEALFLEAVMLVPGLMACVLAIE